MGGQNVPNARGGGELALKVAPRRLGLLTPKLRIFYRISVERGQFQGPLEIQNFHPPSNFRRFDPPYPGLQAKRRTLFFFSGFPLFQNSNGWRVRAIPKILINL